VTIRAAIDRLLRSPVAQLPLWARVIVAVACVAGGAVLTFRPFTSVEVLVLLAGVNAILTGALTLFSRDEKSPAYPWVLGLGWIALGVVLLARPGLGVDTLAVIVGVALVVNGALDILKALAGRVEERAAEFLSGAAAVVFGILALSWPDLTVLVVAVLFGARTVLFGLSQLFSFIPWRRKRPAEPQRRGWFRRGVRVVTRLAALVVALALLGISTAIRSNTTKVPKFYDWTAAVPTTPGTLLRSEPMTGSIPNDTRAWRILYSTKTSLGDPAVGSAFVLASKDLPKGPRRVILWDHGTVGIDRPCAPSLFDDVTAGVPSVPEALAHGWVMVAPDYVGMGTKGPTPYLIGTGQAYSALDAARAAHHLSGLTLSNQTVVWGHSQGGNAALWTGHLAPSYAPQLKIDGVAALAPASDLIPLAKSVEHAAAGTVVTGYFLTDYANTYKDVNFDDYVRPGARVQVRKAAQRCLTDPGLAASVIAGSGGQSIFGKDLTSGPLGKRLRENTPTADMGSAPLLVAGGTGDEVINISINRKWVRDQCAAGYKLDFRTYANRTHMGVLDADSPLTKQLTRWTADRFAGKPAPNTC
jgi:uncharacterized membrane protein HdeD (DUF308 family)/acetyl esterase/lipase